MCGILGIVAWVGSRSDADRLRTALRRLVRLSQQRGRDSSGLAALAPDGTLSILKRPLSPARLMKTPEFRRFLSGLPESGPLAVIGHSRMATSGTPAAERNNQPLQRDGLVLVHNGVLANDGDLWSKVADPSTRTAEVDSEALLALISDRLAAGEGLDAAARHAFGLVEGSASIAAIDGTRRQLLLATNTGSLHVMRGQGVLVFASERYFLERLWADPRLTGLGYGPPSQVAAGNGLVVGIDDGAECPIALPYGRAAFPPGRFDFDAGRAAAAIRDWGFVHYDEAALRQLRRCTRCLLPETYPHIAFDAEGVCNYCRNMKPTVVRNQSYATLAALIEGYQRAARDKGRHAACVLPLSGGRDSCYGAWFLHREFGLKPLTYTYDWGMVTDLARRNIARVCGRLGLENILVSADIARKLRYIRTNIAAWLKKPDLGLIPLFMAGDKHFFAWVNRVKAQNGIDLNIWMMSPLENADFKEGFAGVRPHWERERTDYLSHAAKIRLLSYYGFAFLRNPAYLNASIPDTASGFASFYLEPRRDYYNLYDFIPWQEEVVDRAIFEAFNWENAPDTPTTWRVGDGTQPFYNYIYATVAGFTENDTFRSNQIRNGDLARAEALERVMVENTPRIDGLAWFCKRVGIDMADTLRRINAIPKRYAG